MSLPVNETVNDSDPQLRNLRHFFRRAVADLKVARGLSRGLFALGLRARYKGSILGYVWLLATPVAIAGVWIFLQRAGVFRVGTTGVPYAVHVTTGVFLWTGFLRMLNSPIQQLQGNRIVLSRMGFPWEALIIAGWGEVLVEAAVFLGVLAVVYVAFGMSLLTFLSALPALIAVLLLAGAVGLILAPFGILYDDVPRGLAIITYLLFFLTPVVYPVPTTMPGLLTVLANPVGILLVTTRELMTGQTVSFPGLALVTGLAALLTLLLGWLFFRLSVPHIVSKL